MVLRTSRHCVRAQVATDVDFPPYTIVSKGLHYDLRFYDVYKVVRMPYERRDEGKLLLQGTCMYQGSQSVSITGSSGLRHSKAQSAPAGYIGLGAYFDGENEVRLRLRQTQPVVMRFMPAVSTASEAHSGCAHSW